MKLVALSTEQGITRIESSGDITVFDVGEGLNPLEKCLGPKGFASIVVMNLANSSYIDSSGVGWLIQCHGRFQKAGGRLVLHSIAPMVNHCFRVLGMYDVLQIAADEQAAVSLAALLGVAASG